jgi:hypothetical protein
MKVYHGTNICFERIDLNKCSPDNDFGKGFYVTAMKIIYNSELFVSLTDRETGLFEKSWTEIYEMLKKELKM